MEKRVFDAIDQFAYELLGQFPFINIRIVETDYDDSILIYHDYKDEDNDERFLKMLVNLHDKYFMHTGIINVGVSYDYYLDVESAQEESPAASLVSYASNTVLHATNMEQRYGMSAHDDFECYDWVNAA